MKSLEQRHIETEPLLGAYVLNAVEGTEADQVAAHLDECAICSGEVAGHREVVEMLATAETSPPDDLWDRVIGGIRDAPPPLRLTTVPNQGSGRGGGRLNQIMATAVAVAAAVTAVVSVSLVRSAERLGDLEERLASGSIQQAAIAADTDPTNAHMTMTSEDGQYVVDAVVTDSRRGFLVDGELPELPQGRAYQLWGLSEEGAVSLGMIGRKVIPTAFVLPVGAEGLAITSEDWSGAITPTSAPVVNTAPRTT